MKRTNSIFGFWAALLSGIFGVCYVIAQLLDLLGVLKPLGGQTINALLMFPSFLLAFTFVILSLCINNSSDERTKLFGQIGLAFAIIYSVLIIMVYYTQLALINPHWQERTSATLSPFVFSPFDSFLFAMDVLGYGVMNLSTLFFSFVFLDKPETKALGVFLLLNGVLFPANMLSMIYPPLLFVDSPWAITFPASMILLTRYYIRKIRIS